MKGSEISYMVKTVTEFKDNMLLFSVVLYIISSIQPVSNVIPYAGRHKQ
jgi:hypothetical protein